MRLEFRGAQISSDGGRLVMRELDDELGLSNLALVALRDTRGGKNTVHRLDGLFCSRSMGARKLTMLIVSRSTRSCVRL